MGWLKLDKTYAAVFGDGRGENTDSDLKKDNLSYTCTVETQDPYPFQPVALPDASLPFIQAEVVRATKSQPDRLWIVVDEIIYNCTDFIAEHPGGSTVIESFCGEDCTWQFWRFHNRTHMRETGRPLRIGRTAGIANRYKERPRFVGLRRLGDDSD